MRENIEIARARGFSDIITDTFGLFSQNFKSLMKACFIICGLFIAANIIISSLVDSTRESYSLGSPTGLFQMLISFINYVLMITTVQAYFALYKEKGNQRPGIVEVWGYVRYYFFRVLWTNLILFVLTVAGTFLCFVPGIYLGVVFSLVTPIMIIENGNFQYSFNKAFKVIKGNWWFCFGLLLLIAIIIFAAVMLILVLGIFVVDISASLSGKNLGILAGILLAVVLAVSQVLLTLPFTTSTLLYFALTEEKDGTSLLDRISNFGQKDSTGDQLSSEQY